MNIKTFEQLGVSTLVTASLEKMNFTVPTKIQNDTIPFALQGKDVLASAQTGTGKTGAFSIPLVSLILESDRQGLILTPTRELASQVMGVIRELIGSNSSIKTAFIIGGEPMGRQLKQLQSNPRIIVGTPGRINDHLKRKTLDISKTDFLVIDETDRMLDMGFSVQIDAIIKHMAVKKQTLMFSATISKEIVSLAKKYLKDPERVCLDSELISKSDISQEIIKTSEEGKYDELKKQLDTREGSVVVFVNTKHGAEKLAKRISFEGHSAKAIHGDLRQERREQVVKSFRKQNYRVMIATDVASRGLDIPHIEHVINYDLPQSSDDYIHRIGRTGRAGAKGASVCFITPKEHKKSFSIRKIIDPTIEDVKPTRGGAGPEGRKKSFGRDKSNGSGGERRSFDRPARRDGDGFGASKRSFNKSPSEGGGGERRSFDRPARRDGEGFGAPKRSFNKAPSEGGGGERRSFDRPARRDGEGFGSPKRSFNKSPSEGGERRIFDRPARRDGEGFDASKRSFNKAPSEGGERRSFEKAARRDGEGFGSPKRSFNKTPSEGGRERKSFDRPARRDGEGFGSPKRSFNKAPSEGRERRSFDRPARRDGEGFGSSKRSFNKSPSEGGGGERRSFDRPARRDGEGFGSSKRSFNKTPSEGGRERKSFDKPAGKKFVNRDDSSFKKFKKVSGVKKGN